MKKILIIILAIVIVALTILYYQIVQKQKQVNNPQEVITTTTRKKTFMLDEVPADQVKIANPASQYCIENKGKLEIRKDINKGEYGVCVFENNKQCEE